MITWANVEYIVSDEQSPTYNYQLFYRSKKELSMALSESQSLVEEQLSVKLNISYKNRMLYLTVQTERVFNKDVLINKILDSYQESFSKTEKFLEFIEEICICSNAFVSSIEVMVKPKCENFSTVFTILENRGAILGLVAELNHQNSNSFFLISEDKISMEELLVQKDLLLLPQQRFYEQCKLPAILAEKNVSETKKEKLNFTSHCNFPLSNISQIPIYSNSQFWFNKRKPVEVVNLVDEDTEDKVASTAFEGSLNFTLEELAALKSVDFTSEELEVFNLSPQTKRQKTSWSTSETSAVQSFVDLPPDSVYTTNKTC